MRETSHVTIGTKLRPLNAGTLASYVTVSNGCWLWTGKRNKEGYGRWGAKFAHRLSYEIHKGPIPAGMHIDHLCFNPSCVRPDHLRAVDPEVNSRRNLKALATECAKGHLYTPENTGRQKGSRRYCRICNRAQQRRRYLAKKAAREVAQ
jgi:hypothetical protein